jgi:phosphinothricin acetyltransferase
MITIRTATVADAEKLLAIYAPYVENTAITFEYTVPSVEEFAERIKNTLADYPYLAVLFGKGKSKKKPCNIL